MFKGVNFTKINLFSVSASPSKDLRPTSAFFLPINRGELNPGEVGHCKSNEGII